MAKVHFSTQDPKIKYKACIKQMYEAGHGGIMLKIILRHVCHEGSRFRTRGMRILFYFEGEGNLDFCITYCILCYKSEIYVDLGYKYKTKASFFSKRDLRR
jgi:hypothetical protein